MKTLYQRSGAYVSFILAGVHPAYHEVLRHLGYAEVAGGFAKTYRGDTPHLERIYETFARHAEAMVLQAARVQPVPWERALMSFLELVEGHELTWWLRGSAALAVRGLEIQPRDIDLTVSEADVHRLDELMLDYLVEPLVPVKGWFCNWWSRAFWHARIEWMGGVLPAADEPEASDFGPEAERLAETVAWRGHGVRVPPLALQLRTSEQRGLVERAEAIRRFLYSP